jgi:hypothetical protein
VTTCSAIPHIWTPRCTRHFGSDADFQFVNIAHWRSAEEFTEAVSSAGFREASADLRWRFHPALYRVVRTQVSSP